MICGLLSHLQSSKLTRSNVRLAQLARYGKNIM